MFIVEQALLELEAHDDGVLAVVEPLPVLHHAFQVAYGVAIQRVAPLHLNFLQAEVQVPLEITGGVVPFQQQRRFSCLLTRILVCQIRVEAFVTVSNVTYLEDVVRTSG